MTKKELKNDMKFICKYLNYGLYGDFEIYKDTIILNSPIKDIYVLFDKDYNTIGIHKVEPKTKHLTMEEISELYTNLYNLVDEKKNYCFSYPFQNFSLKEIIDISDRIHVKHSSEIFVNGDLVINEDNENYINLLLYIKFLGEQIKQYFLNAYQMKIMGFDYPDVYEYVNRLIANINMCIDDNIKNNRRPLPIDIINYLGQERKNIDKYNYALYNIIDLLLKEKGFKLKNGFYYRREIEPTNQEVEDLSVLANNLLKLLELPKKDFNILEAKVIDNLKHYLESNTNKAKTPTLKKTKNK